MPKPLRNALSFAVALMLSSLGLASASQAQSLLPCDGWQASARNLSEPWEQSTRTFANGAIRLAVLDTIEPAAGAFYIMVISPPYDELGSRACHLVAEDGGSMGLAGVQFSGTDASYDPARGLTVTVPVQRWNSANDSFYNTILAITINQATGEIRPGFY